jgi:hypothetical protein
MEVVVTRSLVRRFAFVLVLALGFRSTAASAGIPERLKWVRGTVASVTSSSVTTQLREKTLLLVIDDATEVILVTSDGVTHGAEAVPATAYLKAGDAVEVHYHDSRPSGTARYIWIGISLDANSISKRPGTSAAGSIADLKPAHWLAPPRMTLTSGKDRRRFDVTSGAQIMDAQGTVARAKMRLPPAADAIEPNDRVVVVYRQHRSTLYAQMIRMLPARQ